MRKQVWRGFTLIELLIVVAIIAILAAIAVPNFLEAQVRAKVSRAHADMRTEATAIEAYQIDWNTVPIGRETYYDKLIPNGSPPLPGTFTNRSLDYVALKSVLTTPVAYLSSIYEDPFGVGGIFSTGNAKNPAAAEYPGLVPYAYESYPTNLWTSGAPIYLEVVRRGYNWMEISLGPTRNQKGMAISARYLTGHSSTPIHVVYDPSNGTVSTGAIIRTNQGIFSGPNYWWR